MTDTQIEVYSNLGSMLKELLDLKSISNEDLTEIVER